MSGCLCCICAGGRHWVQAEDVVATQVLTRGAKEAETVPPTKRGHLASGVSPNTGVVAGHPLLFLFSTCCNGGQAVRVVLCLALLLCYDSVTVCNSCCYLRMGMLGKACALQEVLMKAVECGSCRSCECQQIWRRLYTATCKTVQL